MSYHDEFDNNKFEDKFYRTNVIINRILVVMIIVICLIEIIK
jgi:hypothetical protein